METEYKLTKVLNHEIVVLDSKYGTQVWAISNLTKRHKDDNCGICSLKVGNRAYRPTTNKSNRMVRICIQCIDKLKKKDENAKSN
ncbi:hypothetical protein LCGC14_2689070 [marine sediment metagenome]|uniref:Uncharacterized protein n=1 Tax=marine sediment metagenome TaxID=412755 RepID=A0A0F9CAS1_9ZZZZ